MTNDRKKKPLRCGVLWVCLILIFMGDGMAEKKKKEMIVLKEGTESRISVSQTGPFYLKIPSNPTTGYSWSLQKMSVEGVVKYLRIEEDDDEDAVPGPMGAPTYETFVFEALKRGRTIVYLQYRRPWEKDTPPIKIHKIHIHVK